MNTIVTLLALAILLGTAAFDIVFTERKLREYGIKAEVNRFIELLARHLPLDWAIRIGIGVPTAVIAFFGLSFPPLLFFMSGARASFCMNQIAANEILKIGRSGRP